MTKQELKEKIESFVDTLCKDCELKYGRIIVEIAYGKCVSLEITDKHKREKK